MAAVVLMLGAACGSSSDDSSLGTRSQEGSVDTERLERTLGVGADAAEAADADRVIEIAATDDLRFEPAHITLVAGETVTFRVANTGRLPHDFTLGTDAIQQEHGAEMAQRGGMGVHDEPYAFGLAPGQTKEMTWHFPESAQLTMGCHVPGHYAAGMRGSIRVDEAG